MFHDARHTQISHEAQSYLDETPLTVRRSLIDAMEIYDNEDAVMRDRAIDAIAEGRAVFWTTAKYHNAAAYSLCYALNDGVDIVRAVENTYPAWKIDSRIPSLETIVPLNRKAVNALSLAYAEMAGTWRDDYELERRKLRDCRRAVA